MVPLLKLIFLLLCVKTIIASSWDARCYPWAWQNPTQTVHLPHPTDCGQFLTCVPSGGTVPQRCPAGLHWNDRQKVCDWPWSAGCNLRPEVGCSFGQLLPHVDCDKYYLCLDNSRKVVLYCPENLHFNANSKKCVHRWYAGCGGWTPPAATTPPPGTTSAPSTTPALTPAPTPAPTPNATQTPDAPISTNWPETTITETSLQTNSSAEPTGTTWPAAPDPDNDVTLLN